MSDFHESGPEIPKPQQYNSDDYAHRIPEAIARIEYNIRLAVLAEDISKMFMEQNALINGKAWALYTHTADRVTIDPHQSNIQNTTLLFRADDGLGTGPLIRMVSVGKIRYNQPLNSVVRDLCVRSKDAFHNVATYPDPVETGPVENDPHYYDSEGLLYYYDTSDVPVVQGIDGSEVIYPFGWPNDPISMLQTLCAMSELFDTLKSIDPYKVSAKGTRFR
mgnify:FL=1